MRALDYLKGIFKGQKQGRYATYLNDATPIFTSYGRDIYFSDFVNNAIDRVATEISKISIKSVVERGEEVRIQNDDITRLFRTKPNPLQTTSDFLSSVEWLRRKHCNAFIYPQYELIKSNDKIYKRYIAFYPLQPASVSIGVNNGEAWEVKLIFEDGSSWIIPYTELIHMKWRRGTNAVLGGDDYGKTNNTTLHRTIDALDKTIQGLPKSIEASMQIKGVYHAKTLADAAKLSQLRNDFESHLMKSKTGIVATDMGGDFTPVNIKAAEIPEDVLKFLRSIINEKYGISEAIMSGDYDGEQHSAFYETTLEDFIIQLEQAMTACLFSPRELDVGHTIKCYYSKVRYMSTKDKIDIANLAKETGVMTLNQINEMFGIEPFEEGYRRLQSLNYVSIDIVDEYQKGRVRIRDEEDTDQIES